MNRKFLEDLGIEKDTIDKILDEVSRDIGREKSRTEQAQKDLTETRERLAQAEKDVETAKATAGDAESVKKALSDLQAKYDKDTGDLKGQLESRAYTAAVKDALSKSGVKFTSKGAEKVFMDAAAEKKLKIKDGALEGWDEYLKSAKEADPGSFASEGRKMTVDTQAAVGVGTQKSAPANLTEALHEKYQTKG